MDSLQDDNNWIRHAARAIALVTGSNEEETIAAIIEQQYRPREPFLTADAASLESITREVAKRIEQDVRHHHRRVWLLGRIT